MVLLDLIFVARRKDCKDCQVTPKKWKGIMVLQETKGIVSEAEVDRALMRNATLGVFRKCDRKPLDEEGHGGPELHVLVPTHGSRSEHKIQQSPHNSGTGFGDTFYLRRQV
jgi:hypothetical protein